MGCGCIPSSYGTAPSYPAIPTGVPFFPVDHFPQGIKGLLRDKAFSAKDPEKFSYLFTKFLSKALFLRTKYTRWNNLPLPVLFHGSRATNTDKIQPFSCAWIGAILRIMLLVFRNFYSDILRSLFFEKLVI